MLLSVSSSILQLHSSTSFTFCMSWRMRVRCQHYCCGATEGSKQQHNQDLKEIYKGATNSRIHHFLPQCIAFNQSALRHEQLK